MKKYLNEDILEAPSHVPERLASETFRLFPFKSFRRRTFSSPFPPPFFPSLTGVLTG